jgi:hypothetical protein
MRRATRKTGTLSVASMLRATATCVHPRLASPSHSRSYLRRPAGHVPAARGHVARLA